MTSSIGFKKIKNTLLGDKNFYSKVFVILLPMIVQNTVTNVVSLLDNVMVGRVGTIEMSAVAIVNQLLFVFSLCIFGGLAGAGIFSAQYAGAKDDGGVRYCFRMKCYVAVLMLLLAFIVFLVFPNNLINAYLAEGTSPEDALATLKFGKQYLFIMLTGLIPFALSQVYASTLRELGETKLPMIATVIAILTNLIFNYLLIFGKLGFPKLGVAGAAIATVLSRYVEMLIIMIFAHTKKSRFPFIKGVYASLKIPADLSKKIIRSGFPLLINEFLWSLSMAMLLQCYSVRGLNVVAASNIAGTAANLFNVAFISMGGALSIMLGQALGAGNNEKAKDMVWKLISLSVFLSLIMGIFLALLSKAFPLMYNTEEEVRHIATFFLLILALIMPVNAFSHCCYFIMRSGGRTIITFLFDSVIMWGINIPVAFALCSHTSLSIVTVYLLVQSLDILKCILGFILVKKGIWIRNIVK